MLAPSPRACQRLRCPQRHGWEKVAPVLTVPSSHSSSCFSGCGPRQCIGLLSPWCIPGPSHCLKTPSHLNLLVLLIMPVFVSLSCLGNALQAARSSAETEHGEKLFMGLGVNLLLGSGALSPLCHPRALRSHGQGSVHGLMIRALVPTKCWETEGMRTSPFCLAGTDGLMWG